MSLLWGKHNGPCLEVHQINLDRLRRFFLFLLVLLIGLFVLLLFFLAFVLLILLLRVIFFFVQLRLVLFALLGVLFFLLFIFLILFTLLVVARRERRGDVFAQGHRHELGSVRINPGIIQVAVHGCEIAPRTVKEIFAVRIQHRFIVVVIAACHDVRFSVLGVVKGDGRVPVLQVVSEGQPAAVFGPTDFEGAEVAMV